MHFKAYLKKHRTRVPIQDLVLKSALFSSEMDLRPVAKMVDKRLPPRLRCTLRRLSNAFVCLPFRERDASPLTRKIGRFQNRNPGYASQLGAFWDPVSELICCFSMISRTFLIETMHIMLQIKELRNRIKLATKIPKPLCVSLNTFLDSHKKRIKPFFSANRSFLRIMLAGGR